MLTLPGVQWLQFLRDKKQLSSKMLYLALQTSLKLTSRVIQATQGCYGNQHVSSAKNKIKIWKKSLMLQPPFQYLPHSLFVQTCVRLCVCVCVCMRVCLHVPEWELGIKNHTVLFHWVYMQGWGSRADLNCWGGGFFWQVPQPGKPQREHCLFK